MKWWRFTFVIILVAVLQASAAMNLLSLTNWRIKPDFLLILLVYFAVYCDSYDAVIISFAVGFAADITGMVIGPHFVSYGIIGAAIAHIRKIILLKTTRQQAMAVFVTGILAEAVALFLTQLKASELIRTGALEVFAASAYSAILWFLIKWPVVTIGKWVGVGVHRFGLKTDGRV
jgi:rod shape-determining protein MreD